MDSPTAAASAMFGICTMAQIAHSRRQTFYALPSSYDDTLIHDQLLYLRHAIDTRYHGDIYDFLYEFVMCECATGRWNPNETPVQKETAPGSEVFGPVVTHRRPTSVIYSATEKQMRTNMVMDVTPAALSLHLAADRLRRHVAAVYLDNPDEEKIPQNEQDMVHILTVHWMVNTMSQVCAHWHERRNRCITDPLPSAHTKNYDRVFAVLRSRSIEKANQVIEFQQSTQNLFCAICAIVSVDCSLSLEQMSCFSNGNGYGGGRPAPHTPLAGGTPPDPLNALRA